MVSTYGPAYHGSKENFYPIFFVLLSWITVKYDPQIHKRIRPRWEVLLGRGAAVKTIWNSCQLAGLQPAVTPLITQAIKESRLLHTELRPLKWWAVQMLGASPVMPHPNCLLGSLWTFPMCAGCRGNGSCQTVVVGRAWCLSTGSDQTLVLLLRAQSHEQSFDPKACLILPADLMWLSGVRVSLEESRQCRWPGLPVRTCSHQNRPALTGMSGLLLYVYSSFFDKSFTSWLSKFTAKQTVICDPR